MTYTLIIGEKTFSSWSLRGWLLLEKFGIPFRARTASLYSAPLADSLRDLAPARLVPVLVTPDGTICGETLAIAETLAEAFPDAGYWPADPAARVLARWISAEMHAGFTALRGDCPMQLIGQYRGFVPSQAVLDDVARIDDLISLARNRHGAAGPWIFGEYSAADAFYAPVAARIAGYGLPVSDTLAAYVATTLADPSFRRWRAMGGTEVFASEPYALALPRDAWAGPAPRVAQTSAGPSVNGMCPYSGRPVTDFLELEGSVYGFCNPTCRDKTLADPEAWPDFMELVNN
ncbi:glutathione S-transferase [Pseudooceanicola aestuarii]|uniref:glutathione S-transferase n=1 Tax=Pseudooceanicola aestuarii TaxID=2697319 RepID=UPI0013D0449E|nr:glutathione S-transferase [Pseudooceanicola aestuarii]